MKKVICRNLEDKLFLLLLILSPVLDIFISFLIKFNSSFAIFGSLIRGLILAVFLCYIMFIAKKKNEKIMKYIYILICYIFIFLLNNLLFSGIGSVISEIKALIKYMFFPLMLLTFLNFKKNSLVNKSLYACAIIYSFFILVPFLLKIDYHTYDSNKIGTIGLFNSANEISAILAMLSPFVIYFFFKCKTLWKKILLMVIAVIYIKCCSMIGTKVSILGVLGVNFLLLFNLIFMVKKFKDNKINILYVIIVFFCTTYFFLTGPLIYNINLQKNNQLYNNESVEVTSLENNHYDLIFKLGEIKDYSFYDTYQTSKLVNLVFSSRDIYLVNSYNLWKDSSLYEKTFGMGLLSFDEKHKSIEIDYFDIFFSYGIVGFVIYFGIIIYLAIKLAKYFFLNFKNVINNYDLLPYYISVLLVFAIAFFAGHVFSAPAVSMILAIVFSTLYKNVYTVKYDNHGIVNFNWIKKLVPIILAIAVMTIGINYYEIRKEYNINITLNSNDVENNNLKIVELENMIVNSDYASDTIKIYEYLDNGAPVFRLMKVDRSFDNDIVFTYYTGVNFSNNKINLNTVIDEKITNKVIFDSNIINKEFLALYGYDKRTMPIGYFENDNSSKIVYKTYHYKIKYNSYSSANYSYYKDFISENSDVNYDGDLNKELKLNKGEMFDTLIISDNERIFKDEKEINEYIDVFVNNYSSAWLAYDGGYTKIPYSIEPFSKEGYGRILGQVPEKYFLSLYDQTNNDLYLNYVLASVHSLENYYPRIKDGVWLSEYTSTFVKKNGGMIAPYVDTKHNDSLAIYFKMLGEYFESDKFMDNSLIYADFLVKQDLNNYYNQYEWGKLTPDYFSRTKKVLTHTSLNHQLSIINNLLYSFEIAKLDEYKDLAMEYIETISNMYEFWIKDNGDLWYMINLEGEFEGTDYELLTLDDLLTTQSLLKRIDGKVSKELNVLVKSKYSYLKSINYPIPSDIIDKLEKLGVKK